MSLASCPECGAEFPAGRLACPECGSDAETGWKDEDEIQYQSIDLPEEEAKGSRPAGGGRYLILALILAVLGMLIFILVR